MRLLTPARCAGERRPRWQDKRPTHAKTEDTGVEAANSCIAPSTLGSKPGHHTPPTRRSSPRPAAATRAARKASTVRRSALLGVVGRGWLAEAPRRTGVWRRAARCWTQPSAGTPSRSLWAAWRRECAAVAWARGWMPGRPGEALQARRIAGRRRRCTHSCGGTAVGSAACPSSRRLGGDHVSAQCVAGPSRGWTAGGGPATQRRRPGLTGDDLWGPTAGRARWRAGARGRGRGPEPSQLGAGAPQRASCPEQRVLPSAAHSSHFGAPRHTACGGAAWRVWLDHAPSRRRRAAGSRGGLPLSAATRRVPKPRGPCDAVLAAAPTACLLGPPPLAPALAVGVCPALPHLL